MYINIYLNYHISNMVILIPNFHIFISLHSKDDIILIWLEPTVLQWKLGFTLKWPKTEPEIVEWRYACARGEEKNFGTTLGFLIYQIKHHVTEKPLFHCVLQNFNISIVFFSNFFCMYSFQLWNELSERQTELSHT